MTLFTTFIVVLGLGLAGTGCKGKSGSEGGGKKAGEGKKGGKVGACNRIKTDSLCIQYGSANFEAAGEKYLRDFCKGMKAEFKLGPCPKDKLVGSCATPEGTKMYYRTGGYPYTAAKGEKACKEGMPKGTWKAAK
jgi:hypothetical protein